MESALLPILSLQFFVAALLWLGAAPLGGVRVQRGPTPLQGDLMALVLPVVLVVCGLLFFAAPLSHVWRPMLHGAGGWEGFDPALGVRSFTLLNLAVLGAAVSATGGTRRSPFTGALVLFPGILWGARVPGVDLFVAMGIVVIMAGVLTVPELKEQAQANRTDGSDEAAPSTPFALRLSRAVVWVGALSLVALAFWFGAGSSSGAGWHS